MSTIHFYIILKHQYDFIHLLSSLEYHTFLHHSQTECAPDSRSLPLEYHTFLHHSQTRNVFNYVLLQLEYHTFLHHSQTYECLIYSSALLEYHTFLHHSQTSVPSVSKSCRLEYHTFLHHSQTSNSKIKCYHRHKNKVLKLNYSINFTSVSIYNITHSSFHATSFMIFNK